MRTKHLLYFTILLSIGLLTACTRPIYYGRSSMPPGQAKKYYGTQSAKPFAPGQQKKRYR